MKNLYTKSLLFLSMFLMGICFAANAQYNTTVAQDGSGNYVTVQAAIDAAPTGQTVAYKIYIKKGKYREKLSIPSNKPFIYLIGEDVGTVTLSWDDYSGKPMAGGGTFGTANSASVTFNAPDCGALNITFENTTGDAPQALAVSVNADRCAFKNCRFLGGQDTVLTNGNGNRQYFRNCYIDGVVDFIFGAAVAVFDSCVIYPKNRLDNLSGSYMTAANTPAGQTYGYVFRDCVIPANRGITSYVMGRPWQNDGSTTPVSNTKVVMINTTMSSSIKPQGWDVWSTGTNTALITYAEYRSRKFDSSLVDISQRVSWSQQLDATQAATYTLANIFGTWNPCSTLADICTYTPKPLVVSNFRGVKGTSTSTFTWNISWPLAAVKYEVYRSNDRIAFSKIAEQTSPNDTAVNYNYAETIPPPGVTYYYYILSSKTGFTNHRSDTIAISSTPTITVTGALGSFLQGLGTPSTSQSYVVSGASLTNNLVVTAPAGYELSTNGGTTWSTSGNPIVLVQDANGNIANTSISVRLNSLVAGTFNGNIVHTSTGATTANLAVAGTVQSAPLTVQAILQQWPMTTNANDSAAVRSMGLVASTPTLNKLYLSNGTTVASVPAYSATHGQAFGATANGDGTWTTAAGGPGGNLGRTYYEQFTITAASTHSVEVDSFILTSSFYNTSSNTKLAVVYSKTGFTTADSIDVTSGLGADGLTLPPTANGAFATPVLLVNETAGTTATYRFALAGSAGIMLASGQTLTIRLYFSCGSGSNGRYVKVKNVQAKGLITANPATGDYRSKQTGDWTDLATWERWDGTTWVTPAPAYPVYNNSGLTTIMNGHTVTLSATPANGSGYIHTTKINAGGQLIVNSAASLNIANDGNLATTDLQVDGALTLLGGFFTNGNVSVLVNGSFVNSGTNMNLSNNGDTVRLGSAGIYQHNANSSNSPKVLLAQPTSTFSVTGITTSQTGLFKNTSVYGNIIWNNAAQANYYAIRNTLDSINVKGSFTVASTGSTYLSFANTSCRIALPGGYIQTGGTVNFRESGNITDTLSVGGDFSVTGGSFLSNAGTGSSLLVKMMGTNKTLNYNQAGGTNTNWDVSGNYTLASNLNLVNTGFGVNVTGTFNMATNIISGAGNFALQPAAYIGSGSATGLNGNITASGTKTFSTGANYIFNGAIAQTTGVLLPATINSLTINNTGADVSLSVPTTVATSLTLSSGNLLLGANNIITNSVLGSSNTRYVVTDGVGALKINNIGVGNNVFPVGASVASYTPAIITNTGTIDNFSVRVKNTFDNTVPNPDKVVNKQWTINEDVAGGSNLVLGLSWLTTDQGANFLPNGSVNITNYQGSGWAGPSATVTGLGTLAAPYTATASAGIATVGNFTVMNFDALPLTLISFNASDDNGQVKLTWKTANETNLRMFVVEKSMDGTAFSAIGTVQATNRTGNNIYNLIDANFASDIIYYRLKAVNIDGSYKYSSIVVVNRKLHGTVAIYPNPTTATVTITHAKANTQATVEIFTMEGKKAMTENIAEGTSQTTMDVSKLPAGAYLIKITNGTQKTTLNLLKQ